MSNWYILFCFRLGGAFTSYVRRRGEPDGRTATAPDATLPLDKMRKPPVIIGRPGGGGESDAAFTPSPPVVHQTPETHNITLTLAHQSRIRSLYPQSEVKHDSSHRPDSSSSASSATDWDNGHATVLRRQSHMAHPLPPIPPPRSQPMVDLPMSPLYNNLAAAFENSSDSELEKMEAKLFSHSYNNQKPQRPPFKKGTNILLQIIFVLIHSISSSNSSRSVNFGSSVC